MFINRLLHLTYNSYICNMKLDKQIKALSILNTGRYIIKEDKIYNRSGVELFTHPLPTGYIQCVLFNGKRYGRGEKVIVYKHILIYLANNGTFEPSLVIGHMDNNNRNNLPSNLKAITQSENKLMSPTSVSRKVLVRISSEQIEQITHLYQSGVSQSAVAKKLGLERLSVRYHLKGINKGRTEAKPAKLSKSCQLTIERLRLKQYLKTISKD